MSSRTRASAALLVLGVVLMTGLASGGSAQAASASTAGASAATGSSVRQVAASGASAGTAVASASRAAGVSGPVVLLGTSGLRWDDVSSDTPALYSLLQYDSAGWLATRSVRSFTCPVDGWLAVSSGRRAADVPSGPDVTAGEPSCRQPQVAIGTPGGAGTVTGWQSYRRQAASDTYEASPGLLGDTLRDSTSAGSTRTAAAVGPGAAIALADQTGQVAHAWPGRVDDAGGTVDPTVLADDVTSALKTDPALLVVDLGQIRDPAYVAKGAPKLTGGYARSRAQQVQSLDNRLGLVLGELQATKPNATVIVASLADSGTFSQLQLIAARGPAPLGGSFQTSLLGSTSTRQDGLAQTTDLMPTLLTALGTPVPDDAVGSPVEPVRSGGTPATRLLNIDDIDEASTAVHPIVPWFFNGLVIAQIVLYGVATLVLRRSQSSDPAAASGRRRTLRWLRQGSVVFASVPAATFPANLLPWWRAASPGLAVTGAVILFVVPISLFALLGPWRKALLGPMAAVGGVTAAVLGGDVLTHSHLMLSSLMGLQPVIAGRFYGFGNPAFALFATGSLMLAIGLADWLVHLGRRREAALAVAAIGILATAVDGTPGLGSDFGGPPAIIPAFAVLALLAAGVTVTWRRALLIVGVTLTVIVSLSLLDWLRPAADRTHLGRFVQTVMDGGAWPVIRRKGEQNVRILFTSWLSALLPFAVAFVVLVLARPVSWGVRPLQLAYDRSPMLRHGLVAFGLLMLIGTAMNDSGTVVPAVSATVAIPLLISASVRALELSDAQRLEAAIAAARKPKRSRR